MDLGETGGERELGGMEEGETGLDVLCETKIYFQLKNKYKQQQ